MTISSSTNKVIYTANGSQTVFSFTFKTFDESHIKIYFDDVEQSSGFTVNLNSDQDTTPGGDVTFDTAPADQVVVAIVREVPLDQEIDYQPYDPFPAETHEMGLDKLTMQNQQQQEELDRATKASISDDGSTDYTWPPYSAGKGIMWSEGSQSLTNSDDDLNGITGAAQQSADDAAASASAAATSETNAATSETNAANSETKAYQWANEAEDVEVEPGEYSAFHWAQKAEESASGINAYTKAESDDRFDPKWVNHGTLSTTSGTSVEWTNIPPGVTRIKIAFNVSSSSSTGNFNVTIGSSSGGFETTGYISSSILAAAASATQALSGTNEYKIMVESASREAIGHMELTLEDTNRWISSHVLRLGGASACFGGGSKTLSDTLDRVRLAVGLGNFDGGSVTLFYQ